MKLFKKNMASFIFSIILIAAFAVSGFAQQQSKVFAVDHSQFKFQGNFVYLEIYYSILRSGLQFKQEDDGFHAAGLIRTYIVKDKKGMMVDSLIITDFVKSLNEIKNTQKFAQQSLAQIESGEYELICQFTDLVRKKSITIRDSLKIRAFPDEKLTMSDIELASSIARQSPAENNFDKNGLRVIPNATKIYGSGFDELHYYAEVYNLAYANGKENSAFHANYFVIDNNGKIIKEVTGSPLKKPGSSAVINGKFELNALASGFYQFKIEVIDEATGYKTSSAKGFYIFRPKDFITASKSGVDKSVGLLQEFLAMDSDSLNKYFEQLKYLALK